LLWTMSSGDSEEAGIEMAWTKFFSMLMILIWWERIVSMTEQHEHTPTSQERNWSSCSPAFDYIYEDK
jgi:hypothetical protein